jgi:hypothetical protein
MWRYAHTVPQPSTNSQCPGRLRRRLSFTTCLYYFIRYFPVCVLVYAFPATTLSSPVPLTVASRSILFVGTELTPAFHFTPHDCFLWQVWQGVASLLTAVAVDVVLVLRVYAMYARARWVFIVLSVGLVAEVVCMSVSLAFALPGIKFDAVCIVLYIPSPVVLFAYVLYAASPKRPCTHAALTHSPTARPRCSSRFCSSHSHLSSSRARSVGPPRARR